MTTEQTTSSNKDHERELWPWVKIVVPNLLRWIMFDKNLYFPFPPPWFLYNDIDEWYLYGSYQNKVTGRLKLESEDLDFSAH